MLIRKQECNDTPSPRDVPPSDFERRYIAHEIRAVEGEKKIIQGVASKAEVLYDMGWYLERTRTGAFDGADTKDCKCLLNHDISLILGAVSSGSLALTTSPDLGYTNELPDTGTGNDTYTLIRRGDIDKSSFGFTIAQQTWEEVDRASLEGLVAAEVLDRVSYGGMVSIRNIDKVKKIFDVSPVTFPANPDTSVAKRSFDAHGTTLNLTNISATFDLGILERRTRLTVIKAKT